MSLEKFYNIFVSPISPLQRTIYFSIGLFLRCLEKRWKCIKHHLLPCSAQLQGWTWLEHQENEENTDTLTYRCRHTDTQMQTHRHTDIQMQTHRHTEMIGSGCPCFLMEKPQRLSCPACLLYRFEQRGRLLHTAEQEGMGITLRF